MWSWNTPTILDRMTLNNYSPFPPKAMMKARRSKSASFWHHWNGGSSGPDVPFILSKIVVALCYKNLDKLWQLVNHKWTAYASGKLACNNKSPSMMLSCNRCHCWFSLHTVIDIKKKKHFRTVEYNSKIVFMFNLYSVVWCRCRPGGVTSCGFRKCEGVLWYRKSRNTSKICWGKYFSLSAAGHREEIGYFFIRTFWKTSI